MGQRDNIASQPAHRQPPKERLDRTTGSGSKKRDFLSNDRRRVEGPKGARASRSAVPGEAVPLICELASPHGRLSRVFHCPRLPVAVGWKRIRGSRKLCVLAGRIFYQYQRRPLSGDGTRKGGRVSLLKLAKPARAAFRAYIGGRPCWASIPSGSLAPTRAGFNGACPSLLAAVPTRVDDKPTLAAPS
jgi:hypothetical protein